MLELRNEYVKRALSQIPRILGNTDRNTFSPTYGCAHRDYWLDKTSDFPDAVRQFGVQALALVYANEMPGNIYFGKVKIRDWAIAGLNYWASIQHSDGSFDEFYPNERGWVGPTAFTTYTSIESYNILRNEMTGDDAQQLESAIKKAAYFIAEGESEEDHLANHHAMACLAVWKAYKLFGDDDLLKGYKKLWKGFLSYHVADEGWSREYDGIDPGYLSATVSFLGKIYQDNKDAEILNVCRQSIEMCSYFAYPNGFYAGSMGSRNTLHFYPHGFEVFAEEVPLAGAVADKMLQGLSEDKLVPPEIVSDRYLFYRVPEFLQSYLDSTKRSKELPQLPFEQNDLHKYFSKSKIWVHADAERYILVNMAKGGVVKIFDKDNGELELNDCGFIGQLASGEVVTTQWIDMNHVAEATENGCEVTGRFNIVPSNKYFNVIKQIIFRMVLLLIGWKPSWAHSLKGGIRKILMLGNRPVDLWFKRVIKITNGQVEICDEITNKGSLEVVKMSMGDEFFVRYVPQSRYFQSQELDVAGYVFEQKDLDNLKSTKEWTKTRTI
jgi:hypothetical protein